FAQRLVRVAVVILVKIRHRELAQAAVYRVAPAQPDAVGLRDRAPAAVPLEDRDDMVEVVLGAHVEKERRLAMRPERRSGERRALDAVRAPVPNHLPPR